MAAPIMKLSIPATRSPAATATSRESDMTWPPEGGSRQGLRVDEAGPEDRDGRRRDGPGSPSGTAGIFCLGALDGEGACTGRRDVRRGRPFRLRASRRIIADAVSDARQHAGDAARELLSAGSHL